jgi:hypothetical protein
MNTYQLVDRHRLNVAMISKLARAERLDLFGLREACLSASIWIIYLQLIIYTAADSDHLARVYRSDLAQDSEMISPVAI